jgi:hypothetical protein
MFGWESLTLLMGLSIMILLSEHGRDWYGHKDKSIWKQLRAKLKRKSK